MSNFTIIWWWGIWGR